MCSAAIYREANLSLGHCTPTALIKAYDSLYYVIQCREKITLDQNEPLKNVTTRSISSICRELTPQSNIIQTQ